MALQNPHRFLNILSQLNTIELYLIFNLERHLRALEIKRQEAIQKNKALRSAFLAREVVSADEQIHEVIELASHCRLKPNYQNNACNEEQRIANGIAFANHQHSTTNDPCTQNNPYRME